MNLERSQLTQGQGPQQVETRSLHASISSCPQETGTVRANTCRPLAGKEKGRATVGEGRVAARCFGECWYTVDMVSDLLEITFQKNKQTLVTK